MTSTQWETIQETPGSTRVHVHPIGDVLLHETTGDDCICGPSHELIVSEVGPDGWVIAHYALDGRTT